MLGLKLNDVSKRGPSFLAPVDGLHPIIIIMATTVNCVKIIKHYDASLYAWTVVLWQYM